MRIKALALSALIASLGAAQADVFVAGPAYPGDPTGAQVACRVFNGGTAPVKINVQLFNSNGTVKPNFDNCNGLLKPGQDCVSSTKAAGNFAHTCTVSLDDNQPISGGLEVFSNTTTPPKQIVLPLRLLTIGATTHSRAASPNDFCPGICGGDPDCDGICGAWLFGDGFGSKGGGGGVGAGHITGVQCGKLIKSCYLMCGKLSAIHRGLCIDSCSDACV